MKGEEEDFEFSLRNIKYVYSVRVMVFSATFNIISAISNLGTGSITLGMTKE